MIDRDVVRISPDVLVHGDGQESLARAPVTVVEKARRRRFTAAYKASVLASFGACRSASERAALLRREGLYRSHICIWQKQRDEAALVALAPRKRGRKSKQPDPLVRENQRLSQENERLHRKLEQTERIVELQTNLLRTFGGNAVDAVRVELTMQAVELQCADLGVTRLCRALGIPRASYYRRQGRERSLDSGGAR